MPDATATGAELDKLIEQYAEQYPEVTEPELVQQEIYAQAREEGPRWSYPEYEGPGFTEPPADWEGWHQDHSEYEREHYWDEKMDPAREEVESWKGENEANGCEGTDYVATREAMEAQRADYYETTGDPWHAYPVTHEEVAARMEREAG